MPSHDLEGTFAQLEAHLREGVGVSAARSDPFFYVVFPPEQTLEVKRRMRVWTARLRNVGITVEQLSFSDLIWDLVDASGLWDEWLEVEPYFDRHEVNEAIATVLREGDALVRQIATRVETSRPGVVLFLTEAELLHPYFRARALENALHDRVKIPTVVFYPGRRAGQFGLHFLDFYGEDANYRATILGGIA